jgi:hypothetical protein
MGIQPGHIHKPGRIGTSQVYSFPCIVSDLFVRARKVSSPVLGR